MGVTYKLKEEIIEYVLKIKRENSRISCRQLVLIVEDKFQVHVSKSSIGTLIKEAKLSSPIGRPSAKRNSSKKFSIPKDKKKLLFNSDGHLEVLGNDQEDSVPLKDKDLPQKENLIDKKEIVISKLEQQGSINNDEFLKLTKKYAPSLIINETSEMVELKEDLLLNEKFQRITQDSFFKRMALWDFFRGPVLEDFLKRQTSLSQREINMIDVFLCLFPEAMNDSSMLLEKQNLWLWKLNGWEDLPVIEEIDELMIYLKEVKINDFDFNLESTYFFSMIHRVCIILDNGNKINLDGRLKIICSSNEENSTPCPIERSIDEVTAIISGNRIWDFYCPEPDIILNVVADIFGICDLGVKIDKIQLMGKDNKCFFDLNQNLQIFPKFLIFSQMKNEQLYKIFGNNFEDEPKIILNDNLEYYIQDLDVQLPKVITEQGESKKVRVTFCHHPARGIVEFFITNMTRNQISAKQLIEKFSFGEPDQKMKFNKLDEFPELFNNFSLEESLCVKLCKLLENINHNFWQCVMNCGQDVRNYCDKNIYVNCYISESVMKFKFDSNNTLKELSPLKFAINHYFRDTYGSIKILYVI